MNSLFIVLREGFDVIASLEVWRIVSHILRDWVATDGACTELSLYKGHVDDEIDTKQPSLFAGI
jgi:hypothetical protein